MSSRCKSLVRVTEAFRYSIIQRSDGILTDWFVLLATSMAILGFLSLRGSTTTALVLLFLVALGCSRSWSCNIHQDALRRPVLLFLIVFCLPFFALLITQAFRHELILKAYDGPLRIMISGVVFCWFMSKRVNFARLLAIMAPISLIFLALAVACSSAAVQFWGGRYSTYFVDPNAFGVYSLVLLAFCFFSIDPRKGWRDPVTVLQVFGVAVGLYLNIRSGTRGSWLALPSLLCLWIYLRRRDISLRTFFITGIVLALLGAAIYFLLPDSVTRFLSGFKQFSSWLDGSDPDTSTGVRLSMWRMTFELFLHSPWVGYGDVGYRVFLNEPWIASIASVETRATIVNGPHNEFLANVLRSGILGGLSVVVMFFVPFLLFWRRRWHAEKSVRLASHLGMAYLLVVAFSSISVEVFNLVLTASFYGLMMAGLSAQVISASGVGGDISK